MTVMHTWAIVLRAMRIENWPKENWVLVILCCFPAFGKAASTLQRFRILKTSLNFFFMLLPSVTSTRKVSRKLSVTYFVTFCLLSRNRKISGALRRRVLYSPGFYLKAGEYRALSAPRKQNYL